MKEDSVVSIEEPTTNKDVLTEVLREGAQKLLAEAVQAELEELLHPSSCFLALMLLPS